MSDKDKTKDPKTDPKAGARPVHAAGSKQFLFSLAGVLAVFGILVAVNYIARAVPASADFTEDNVHTLSEGTRRILEKVDVPVSVKLYVTQDPEIMPSQLLTRAREFEAFLGQYVRAGGGNFTVEKFNPEPDTDDEDAARLEGIQANMGPRGPVYFGAAIKSLDEKVVLPYIPAIGEEVVEYEVTRAISQVAHPEKTVVGLMSSYNVQGGFDAMNPLGGGRPEPGWIVYDELSRDFEVRTVAQDVEAIEDEIGVLILLHPGELTESALYAIDQFLLRGGKIAAFLDPFSITARILTPPPNPMNRGMPPQGPPQSSNIEKLLGAWGFKFNSGQVVADTNFKTPLQGGRQAPGVLTLPAEAINREDVLTNRLNDLLMLFPGEFTGEPVSGVSKTILVNSSTNSQLVDPMTAESAPEEIARDFKPSGAEKVLALRLTGSFETAFPEGKPKSADDGDEDEDGEEEIGADEEESGDGDAEGGEEEEGEEAPSEPESLKKSTAGGVVVLVGDSDLIYDQFCVQVMELFGQRLAQMRNGNLPFVLNIIEQLAGDTDLIAIRSRASSRRPFTRVNEMEEIANRKIRDQVAQFEEKIDEANARLSEIQREVDPSQKQVLSEALRVEQEKINAELVDTQKKQRELQKEARRELNSLIARIKAVNIFVMPALVAAVGIAVFFVRRAKTSAR